MEKEALYRLLYQNERYAIFLVNDFKQKEKVLKQKLEESEEAEKLQIHLQINKLRTDFAIKYMGVMQDDIDINTEINLTLCK